MRLHSQRRVRFFVLAIVLAIYVVSYGVMSRQAFIRSDSYELEGLWFATPIDGDGWRRRHYGCAVFFAPLILVDNAIGTGRPIVNEPNWGLGPPDDWSYQRSLGR